MKKTSSDFAFLLFESFFQYINYLFSLASDIDQTEGWRNLQHEPNNKTQRKGEIKWKITQQQ